MYILSNAIFKSEKDDEGTLECVWASFIQNLKLHQIRWTSYGRCYFLYETQMAYLQAHVKIFK